MLIVLYANKINNTKTDINMRCLTALKLTPKRHFQTFHYQKQKSTVNYYEILNVKKDCSEKEIRNAFVSLSKKYHPDVTGQTKNLEANAQFIKISEAYHTLIKPKERKAYDEFLYTRGSRKTTYVYEQPAESTYYHRPWEVKPNIDPNASAHYYGIKGLGRLSNSKIAFVLTALCIFGAIFGFASVKHSFTFNRQKLDEKSAEANMHHKAVIADAQKFGNEEQLKRMVDRMIKNRT